MAKLATAPVRQHLLQAARARPSVAEATAEGAHTSGRGKCGVAFISVQSVPGASGTASTSALFSD